MAGPLANAQKNLEIALAMKSEVARLPGIADVRMQQVPRTPDIRAANGPATL